MRIFSLLLLVCIISCHSKQNTSFEKYPLEVVISKTAQYDTFYHKKELSEQIEREDLVVRGDSIRIRFFDIRVEIHNRSSKTAYCWLMSCDWENNLLVNNNYMYLERTECNKNSPVQRTIDAGSSLVYKAVLSQSIKFDYPCSYCNYGPQIDSTKLGWILLTNPLQEESIDYPLQMTDKSKWTIIWSNGLQLLDYKPTNGTIVQ